MRRFSFVFVLLLTVGVAAPASSQPAGGDDSPWNGVAIGAGLGAIGGVVGAGALFADCGIGCDVPDDWHVYTMYGAAGAGGGAAVGWLVDRLHTSGRSSGDPTWDGATKGALIGAGAMAGLLAVNYARCDAGCEAPAPGPMFAVGLSMGAGGGAAVGWLIDKLHKGPRSAAVPMALAVRADREARAVRVQWRF
jgi:hypothetical protein